MTSEQLTAAILTHGPWPEIYKNQSFLLVQERYRWLQHMGVKVNLVLLNTETHGLFAHRRAYYTKLNIWPAMNELTKEEVYQYLQSDNYPN